MNFMNNSKNQLELLSPAGSFDCAKAAILSGADSIYMGGRMFGARAYADSVLEDKINETIALCHDNNKKFYLTVNTLVKNKEFDDLKQYIDQISDMNVDAFIVQDLGVAKFLKSRYKIPLHASTQMAVFSDIGIKGLKDFGFTQVVLPRELNISEIKKIRKNTDLKLEVFIHGSMCYSYSGTCLMSSFMGNNSGNRGRCKGACRLEYSYKNNRSYCLSMKDMCGLKELPELIDAGINSFKIEGRMRSEIYVAGVTDIYRKYIDYIITNNKLYDENKLNNEIYKLNQIYDKAGFSNYFHMHNDKSMIQLINRKKRIPDEKVINEIKNKYNLK